MWNRSDEQERLTHERVSTAIRQSKRKDRTRVIAAIEHFEALSAAGDAGSTWVPTTAEQIGHDDYHQSVDDILAVLYDVQPSWFGGAKQLRGSYYVTKQQLREAPIGVVVRIIFSLSQADRYGDATIGHALNSGVFLTAVRRLKTALQAAG